MFKLACKSIPFIVAMSLVSAANAEFVTLAILSPTTTVSTSQTGNTSTLYSGVADASSASDAFFELTASAIGGFTNYSSSGTATTTLSMSGTLVSDWNDRTGPPPATVYIKKTLTSSTQTIFGGGRIFHVLGEAQAASSSSSVSNAGGAPSGNSADTDTTTSVQAWNPTWVPQYQDAQGHWTYRASTPVTSGGSVYVKVSGFTFTSIYPGVSATSAAALTTDIQLSLTP